MGARGAVGTIGRLGAASCAEATLPSNISTVSGRARRINGGMEKISIQTDNDEPGMVFESAAWKSSMQSVRDSGIVEGRCKQM